jgi:hypothetical protein
MNSVWHFEDQEKILEQIEFQIKLQIYEIINFKKGQTETRRFFN